MTLSMTRIALLAVFGSCLGIQCFAQKKPHPLIDGLVGPVRNLKEWNVLANAKRQLSSIESYDQNGNLITYTTYKDDGGILYGDTNTYNESGRLIETRTVHTLNVYLPDKKVFLYDDRGKLVEVKGFNSADRPLGGELYRYDSQDNMVEEKNYLIGSHLVYNNHLTRRTYDGKGNEISRAQYVYDENGVRPDEFGMRYQKQVFLNDRDGRPVLTGYLKSDNSLVRKETTKYDRRGNTVEEIERGVDRRLLRRITYAYVFDHHGNWIKQVRTEWTAENVGSVFEPVEISLRAITYYRHPYQRHE